MKEIGAKELAERMARGEKPYLLDVRQPWENQLAQIPGSVLVPLGELPKRLGEVAPAAGQTLIAYCHHGARSMNAAVYLEQRGFKDVLSLRDGIEAWSLQVDPKIPRY